MPGQTIHTALSVDVDRFGDKYLSEHILPVISHDGKPVTVAQLRVMCFDYRNRGFEVFPPCDNVDSRGYCQGHRQEDEP